jgi:anaerobic magnesium-protoporphyrin IX monomethyl ester cyclase
MKVLFINAIDSAAEVETRYPSLGFAYLASMLRMRLGASLFDFRIIDRDIETALKEFKPDVVGISAVSQNFGTAERYAMLAKKSGIPVLVGGVHLSALPQCLTGEMDAGCVGEGEETVVDLFSLLLKNGKLTADNLAPVKGIVYREGKTIKVNPPRELVKNLDDVPFPARDLLHIERHSYLFTSRGCPYRCCFCSSSAFWNKTRFFSAEYVVREIEELVENFGVRLISFFDDLFISDKARLIKIVAMVENNERLQKVSFTCSGRANLITDETASLLKRMRVRSVGMGLESGSLKTLLYLKVNNISVEDNRCALRALRKQGIAANASFVIGSPDETGQEMLETYRFIKKNPVCLFDTYVLIPYPGTSLWEYAKAKGLVSDTMDWTRLNVNFYRNSANAVVLSTTMSRKALLKMYRKFQRLRLWKNMLHVWSTPQLPDLGVYMLKRIREFFSGYFRKS